MIEIQLTRGYVAIVDDCDSDLAEFKWGACYAENTDSYYARRQPTIAPKKRQTLQMHRVILGRVLNRELGRHELVDHQNGDTLDNRRSNLRLASYSQNTANSKDRTDRKTPYKGIRFQCGKWMAQITIDKKRVSLGTYATPEEAAIVYNHAAVKQFGEFARVNDIPSWENTFPIRHIRPAPHGYKYVSFYSSRNKWVAEPYVNQKGYRLGYFNTPEEAHQAVLSFMEGLQK